MRVALDTNRYTDLARGDEALKVRLRRVQRVFLPFIVMAELRAGFAGGTRAAENEAKLALFLSFPHVAILYPDEQTTRQYAYLFNQLRRQGTPIPDNDLWIASLAVQHGLHLCTRDSHYDHLPQIPRFG